MAWNSRYSNYGVLKIDGERVLVYDSQTNYSIIYVNERITSAVWAGGDIINVSLSNGQVRRYSDQTTYTTIY